MEFSESDIQAITEGVWGAILGLTTQPCPTWAVPAGDDGFVTGVIRIEGAWQGAVTMHCPIGLARLAAGVMFGIEPDAATSEQVRDAVGELTNMTGGNLKALLPEPCDLFFPEILTGAERARAASGEPLLRVAFECEGQPFEIAIYEGAPAAAAVHSH